MDDLDTTTWILFANWLLETADFVNMPDADLPGYYELLQRRDAMQLPTSAPLGETIN